ncbi:uncharacterized protein LOC144314668 [Canis aureus]
MNKNLKKTKNKKSTLEGFQRATGAETTGKDLSSAPGSVRRAGAARWSLPRRARRGGTGLRGPAGYSPASGAASVRASALRPPRCSPAPGQGAPAGVGAAPPGRALSAGPTPRVCASLPGAASTSRQARSRRRPYPIPWAKPATFSFPDSDPAAITRQRPIPLTSATNNFPDWAVATGIREKTPPLSASPGDKGPIPARRSPGPYPIGPGLCAGALSRDTWAARVKPETWSQRSWDQEEEKTHRMCGNATQSSRCAHHLTNLGVQISEFKSRVNVSSKSTADSCGPNGTWCREQGLVRSFETIRKGRGLQWNVLPYRRVAHGQTEVLCVVAGSGERKFVMAAAILAEKVPVDSSEEGEQPPAAPAELAAQKREQRLRKFRELHLKRNEARKLNHQEVVEEDKRLKLPANWEARKARLEWELQEEEKKKECAARGEDYEKVKLLEISAEDAERWERKKRRKNPDLGFSDYAAAQLRQYHRLTKQIKPDMETYERLREKHGEEFFPTSNSLLHGTHVPSTEEVDRMVIDLEKQIEKRDKYSRRRPYNDDADIDYINERNAKFNKKAERFYGKYTAEIKQNLERGTAV